MTTQDVQQYVKYTKQKYIFAAAICVLKCKPPNISAKDFCKILQSNVKEASLPTIIFPNNTENNSELNKVCASDFPQILRENYSQPADLQNSQIFQNIKDASVDNKIEDNSGILQNFDTLQAVQNIKRIICSFNGKHSFDGINCNDFQSFENNVSSQSTQDSGYYSSQHLSGLFSSFKRNDIGYTQLNASLKILINFMLTASDKCLNICILNYVSEVFGRTIDILYELNVYLSSFDDAVDVIDNMMNQIISKEHVMEIHLQQKCIFTLFLINKSSLLIQHSIMQLVKELEQFLDKLSMYGTVQVLEMSEPKLINSTFFIFHLLEGLLKQHTENKNNKTGTIFGASPKQNNSSQSTYKFTERDVFPKNIGAVHNEQHKKVKAEQVLKERCTNLLNRAVLECVETYPLISFWAMECLNL